MKNRKPVRATEIKFAGARFYWGLVKLVSLQPILVCVISYYAGFGVKLTDSHTGTQP